MVALSGILHAPPRAFDARHRKAHLSHHVLLHRRGLPLHEKLSKIRSASAAARDRGIPVATVAINGGANAGLLAAKILATSDPELLVKLKDYSKGLKESVQKKDARLQEVGYKNY